MTHAMPYPDKVRFTLTVNRNVLLLTLLLLPVLIGLGNWQLQRADEKRQLQAAFAVQQKQAPALLSELTSEELKRFPNYRRVMVEGEFDSARSWLLDNKLRRGRVGYEVVTPVRLSPENWVLVNRGWLPAPARRSELPEIPEVKGTVTLFASVYRPSDNALLETKAESESWPRVIVELDNVSAEAALGEKLAPLQLRLDSDSIGALVTDWKTFSTQPQKHTGYAVQWFAMAAALVICCVCANSNLVSVLRGLLRTNSSEVES